MGSPDPNWSPDDLEGKDVHNYEQDPESVPDQPEEGGEDDQLPIHID